MMKKIYQSTIEEEVEEKFRLAEHLGIIRKLKWDGVLFAPVCFITSIFIIDDHAAGLIFGGVAAGLYLLYHLSTYKLNYRKRTRKVVVRSLGTDQPVLSEYEIDESGLVFRRMGQEIRFPWGNVEDVIRQGDSIEVITAPASISRIPKRIFEDTEELEQWIEFIGAHRETP